MNPLQAIKQFFKTLPQERRIEDPVFGSIYWDSDWWYVNRVFAPTGEEIGISIVTDGAEPDERHRSLYLAIENRYFLLKDTVVDALYATLMKELEQIGPNLTGQYRRENLWEHLRHDGIGIETVNTDPRKWSLEYYCDWSDCVYIIHMEDWTVSEVEAPFS